MKVSETTISELLDGKKHYIVPIFQRIYSWKTDNCEQLFNDIKKLMIEDGKRKEHFIGSIVEIAHKKNSGTLSAHSIIDGQQRFTTCILFILALIENFKDTNTFDLEDVRESYLINPRKENNEKYKILLIEEDMIILKKLIDNEKIYEEDKKSVIYKNFSYFKDEIFKIKKTFSFQQFIDTMKKLRVALITLDSDIDNPQLIFESINSTGLSLSQGDLIKNFILMDLLPEDQENIYKKYWKHLEETLTQFNQLDVFFKHFLTIKTKMIPNENKIYNEFKIFRNNSSASIYEIVEDIYQYFINFEKILKNRFEDEKISKSMKNLKSLKNKVVDPLLMELLNKYDEQLLNSDDLNYLINIFMSYIVRRSFVGLATSILNKAFVTLISKLDNENIKEVICATLLNFENTQKFPNNKEFENNFKNKNFYNMQIKNAILEMIENFENKTSIIFNNYTVEHIMPQGENMPKVWREMLGDNWEEILEKYVQTIGNITLTLYNSELSNNSFEKKKDMQGGFRESQLKLNRFVVNSDNWGEEEIKQRADELYKYCLKIFLYPNIEKEILDKYKIKKINSEYTLEGHKHCNNLYIQNLFNKLWKLFKNINPNLEYIVLKEYIKIIENEDTIGSLVFNKDYIYFTFKNWEEIIDQNKIIIDLTNINRWGTGNARIKINDETFAECENIIEQVIEKYSD